jgi:hypothetical protein
MEINIDMAMDTDMDTDTEKDILNRQFTHVRQKISLFLPHS